MLGGRANDVGAHQGVAAGLTQVVHHGAGANGRSIHPGEPFQDLVSVGLGSHTGHAGQYAIRSQVGHRGHRHAAERHGPGQSLAEVDSLQDILGVGVQVPDNPAHPALGADYIRLTGMPDIHGAEV